MGPGDPVILFGADEWEYTVRLESVQADVALGRIVDRTLPQTEPRCELTLAVALLKAEKLEWILQKGTELGVTRFVLMQTERTVAAPDERRVAGRRERYTRIIQEATEQCGRICPPCIEAVLPFSHAVATADAGGAFLLHTGAAERLSDLLHGHAEKVQRFSGSAALARPAEAAQARHSLNTREPSLITLFVGPEGGFTAAEVVLAGAGPIMLGSLGPRVLRAETAALAAVTLAIDALDH